MRVLVAVLVFVLSLTRAAAAFEAMEIVSPGGIKAWLVEDHTIPLLSLNFSMAGGAATDAPGKEGTAHFLSGMLNEGAGDMDGPGFQAMTERLAINMRFNADTDEFSGSLQTITENRPEAVRLLALALAKPTFPADSMERVRQQLFVAARSADTDPDTIAARKFMSLALPGHPYARTVRGTVQSIAAITRDDLVAAHQRLIRRSGLTISAVGDITPTEFGAMLDQIFLPLPDAPPPPEAPDAKLAEGPKLEIVPYDNPQTLVLFGLQGIAINDPGYFPAVVLAELLGGRSSGAWLNAEVREKRGLTYGISFDINPMEHASLFVGSFSTENAKAGEALKVVRDTLRRMAEEGPTAQQLQDVKTYMTGSYALRFDSTDKIAGYLTALQQFKRPIDFATKRNALIEAVTLEQVKAEAKRWIKADKLIVVAVGRPEWME